MRRGKSRIAAVGAVLTMAVAVKAADVQPVFSARLHDSLTTKGSALAFTRDSEACYFDPATDKIVTVPAKTPRFVGVSETNPWGNSSGILLEGGAINQLLLEFRGRPVAVAVGRQGGKARRDGDSWQIWIGDHG